SASAYAQKIIDERKAGIYSFDAMTTGVTSNLELLRPAGVLDPIRPAIFRPDITGDQYWRDGYDAGFVDKDKNIAFLMAEDANLFWVDSDQVDPASLKSVRDLLDPKWKGRIIM